MGQIVKEREWKKAADELKPKLKERKYSTEKPEKTVTWAEPSSPGRSIHLAVKHLVNHQVSHEKP